MFKHLLYFPPTLTYILYFFGQKRNFFVHRGFTKSCFKAIFNNLYAPKRPLPFLCSKKDEPSLDTSQIKHELIAYENDIGG